MTNTISPQLNESVSPRLVALGRLLRSTAIAAVAGLVVAEGYAASIKAAGVPMKAGFLGASHTSPVNAASFATGVLVCIFWGTVLAALVTRSSRRPVRTFVLLGCCLTVLSLAVPVGAGATAASTKVALVGAHVLVAITVIPIFASALRRKTRIDSTKSQGNYAR